MTDRRFVALVVSSFLAGIPACDCGVTPLSSPPGRLSGVACDEATGEPVAAGSAVTIEVDGEPRTVLTNDVGNWFMGDVPAGTAELLMPSGRRLEVDVVSDETTTVTDTACRDIAAEHPGSISGRVCNAHVGDVVAGADVVVVLADGTRLETTTDADGNFAFPDVPQGSYALSIAGDGYSRTVVVEVGADEAVVLDVGGACSIPEPGATGAVSGLVCASDFGGLVDATVSITLDDGDVLTVQTDDDGRFVLDGIPEGDQVLVIQKGSFRAEQVVVITAGETLQLNEDECALEPDDIRVAFVNGSDNDHLRDVLGSLGINESQIDFFNGDWAEELLSGDAAVMGYDILFLSCRSEESTYFNSSAMRDRLREYVEAGGSVYASDQAYGLIEVTYPSQIDFEGDDDVRAAANKGDRVDDLVANIVDGNMATSFGQTSATLHYPLRGWSVMRSVGNDVDVYVKANAPLKDNGGRVNNAPQIVGFSEGDGRVIYSSFHQEPGTHPDQLHILQLLMFEL
jgi:hypothetical protein